ncbi:MAG: hypothetical protein ACT4NV_08045 [Rhodoferax sp.]
MPYVLRDARGVITTVLAQAPEHGPVEFVAGDAPELLAFLGLSGREDFSRLDQDFIRVIEDLLDLLIHKNIIRLTDLPPEAQHKLLSRKGARERIRDESGLLDDSDLL